MAYTTFKSTEVRPNFLESEIGLVLKTVQVDDTGIEKDEYGYKTVKGGTVYPSNDANAIGIIFEDIDVTHGTRAASIITAGRIYKNRLHTTPASAAITTLNNSGIVFVDVEPATSRALVAALGYTGGTTAFGASDIAETDDGSALTIVAIGSDNDKSIATVALSSSTHKVTATKVASGNTQITCTVADVNGKKTDIVVPLVIS